jgi:hypothetical protein
MKLAVSDVQEKVANVFGYRDGLPQVRKIVKASWYVPTQLSNVTRRELPESWVLSSA